MMVKPLKIAQILLILFAGISQHIFAQKDIRVQMLSPENGLSQSSVLSIYQDSLGFMWIGTRDGLNEYNGNTIKIYKNVIGDSLSLAGNFINDIQEKNGIIWIAHNKGISSFDRRKGTFKNYDVGRQPDTEMRTISIINGVVWTSGWTGIYVLDEEKDAFVKPNISVSENALVFDASVSKIVKSPHADEYWIATVTRGLYRYNVKENTITRRNLNVSKKISISDSERIEDILFHPNGKMYVASYNSGLYECDLSGTPLKQWNSSRPGVYNSIFNNIRSLSLDKNGDVWIGSFHGIGVLNPQTDQINSVSVLYGENIMDKASIRSLFFDKNGSLWIGTYHDGLLLHDDYLSRFSVNYLPKISSSNAHNIVSAFEYKNGNLVVATENGSLFEYDSNNRSVNTIAIRNSKGEFAVIKSLFYDADSRTLLAGTLRDGLYRVKGREIQSLGHNDLGIINAFSQESPGYLWIISDRKNSLNLYNIKENKLESFPVDEQLYELIGKSQGKCLKELSPGKYLLATIGSGLIAFENQRNGKVERILDEVNDVRHILLHKDTVFISTNGKGIYLLNKSLQVIQNLTIDNGLLHNNVFSVLADDNQRWVTYINGVSQWMPTGEFINYYIRNGFPLAEVNEGAYALIPDRASSVVIGGKDAWISFNPDHVYKNPYKPSVYLSDIMVNNSPITAISDFSDIDFLRPRPLKLKHNQTTLTFEFAGLNYIMPENNRYRYLLEGFDNNWKYTDRAGRAEYSKIPSGKYLFKLQASNNDGIWSDELTLPVSVTPPWWLSWQAWLIYVLLLIGVILFVRNNALRKAALVHSIYVKDLEKKQIEQMHNLKVKYFTDISHEIRTPLMLILHPVEELLEEPGLSTNEKKKMQNIQRQGRNLLQLVNQLLEINRVELNKESLMLKPVLLKDFIEYIAHSFDSLAYKNEIKWQVELSDITRRPLLIDTDKMEKILLNLLSNAFKYTPKGRSVGLTVETSMEKDESVSLRIQAADTGIGIAEEDLPHIFERFYKTGDNKTATGSGIGLSLVKAIVENLMNGNIAVESGVGKGSVFTVTIPEVKISSELPVSDTDVYHLPPEMQAQLENEEESIFMPDKNNQRKSVLLVEDNIELLNTLSQKLNELYNVFNAVSAEDALDILIEEDIDIVVSDIMLPGKSGKEFCAEIKSNIITSHIPVILLTAIQHEDVKMQSLEIGADDYLTKPFSYKELQLRMQNILRGQEKLRDLYKRDALPDKVAIPLNRYDSDLLKKIDQCIEQNLSNSQYSVEDLSSDVAISRVHLFRKMKKLLDVSPSRYMRNYRLKKAAEILSREHTRIVDVADEVGFEDSNYFVKCFKEKYGISPSKYSKQIIEE